MSLHTYTKALNHKTIHNMILNDPTFKSNIKTIKTELPDKIEIEFHSPLTGSEALRLSTTVSSLIQADPDVLIDSNLEKITKFSEKLVRDYAKKNLKRAYTTTQVKKITADLAEVTALLNGKALPTVLEVLAQFTPTAEITSEDISEFTADIVEFLGTL